ncbi:MAG: phosphoribosylformylglycinamidine cyclo-ligase [Marinilabiliales bacterium]|nr:MAG: phosphoribosylformylglycinamidine cyclo-ligase [Marinilabiliales bacterium]
MKRGVSSGKEEVHAAVKKLEDDLFPRAFCKIQKDPALDGRYMVLHADGAGTKSALAYAYWKETGDLSVWEGIATDAMVMNTDDMMCTGISNDFYVSSTIGRNKHLISGEVIAALINGNVAFAERMKKHGVDVHLSGGETADVGDLVRTIIVDATALGYLHEAEIISNEKIEAGNLIVGLASYGQCAWENSYNSGIGSNGLSSARHDIFSKEVARNYPESFNPLIEEYAYIGKYGLTDKSPLEGIDMGKLVLSPTRTYLPLVKKIFENMRPEINGMIHCTGGGQFKTFNYIKDLHIVKSDFLDIPPLFRMIMDDTGTKPEEMYRTFNMGHRLEIYVKDVMTANTIISMAGDVGIDAKIIGHCIPHQGRRVELQTEFGTFVKED